MKKKLIVVAGVLALAIIAWAAMPHMNVLLRENTGSGTSFTLAGAKGDTSLTVTVPTDFIFTHFGLQVDKAAGTTDSHETAQYIVLQGSYDNVTWIKTNDSVSIPISNTEAAAKAVATENKALLNWYPYYRWFFRAGDAADTSTWTVRFFLTNLYK